MTSNDETFVADADAFLALVTDRLGVVVEANSASVPAAAAAIVSAMDDGHFVFGAGAGHSLGGVMELFYRAGGLAAVRPLWHPHVFPLAGALRSTQAERLPGLGRGVVEASDVGPGDVVVVYTNTGVNPYPVEITQESQARGATVVALTSRDASKGAPVRAGVRVAEIADIVLDTTLPPGDAAWPVDAPRLAALSTVVSAFVWDLVLVAIYRLRPDVPAWLSANMVGTDDERDRVLATYSALIPEIAAGL